MTHQEAALVDSLKEKYVNSDNKACFYDREKVLHRIAKMHYLKKPGYAGILAEMLREASTPIEDEDVFAGRMVEAVPEPRWKVPNVDVIANPGHLHFHWEEILKLGMRGILEKIERRARELGDSKSRAFAKNARIQVEAVDTFVRRYAGAAAEKAARSEGEARERFARMARALEVVPMKPAYDLFSALQGIWILHMIASCYAGARDYGFGRIDQYLFPYYEKDLAAGIYTEEEADALHARFADPDRRRAFFLFLQQAFSSRRKTLANSLSASGAYGSRIRVHDILGPAASAARAEDLSPNTLHDLFLRISQDS